ncbi:hypothetical protein BGX27_004379 [Mortierella sp. AM989]|nr:hypothetical protein BGX27_004379 [Mortierella sp. AM989]
MGQNQSHEEPYHRRHYNLTNQQIQRQNSLSLSTPNLLLHRDHAMKRAATFQNNNSTTSLTQRPRSNSAIASTGMAMSDATNGGLGAGNPTPFIRLLPIENEEVYFDESEESEGEEDELDEVERDYEPHRYSRGITTSPSFLEDTLNANTRLSRSDSYEHYPRDRADFQRTKEEEQEDLSYLSPVSDSLRPTQSLGKLPKHSLAAEPFDHDHPRYFDGEDSNDMDHHVKRYQLYDPPMSTLPTTTVKDVEVLDLSVSSRNPLGLDAIREEDEDIVGHSKRPSLAHADQQDRETSTVYGFQPLQEANVNTVNIGTQPTIEELDLYDNVKTDLDRRIHEAVQHVEQQLQDRVQRLEEQTASLKMKPTSMPMEAVMQGYSQEQDSLDVPSYHSRGSTALRKEMLSSASQKVDDLDSRVNQMEYLVSFKLNDIETKVQELHVGHNAIAQTVEEACINQEEPVEQVMAASNEMQMYRRSTYNDIYNDPAVMGHPISTGLVDKASIMELRQELQAFGMRYHELNDGLLTDLMAQLREAKLILFDSVDEVDKKLGMRVDRIEAEMHASLLSDIENRIQERVRAMEQTSVRLERCFDKMESRLGALETVLASKRSRPESMYQVMQQQQQKSQLDKELQRAAFLDPNASPESPMPDRQDESFSKLKISPSTPNTISRNYDSNSPSSISSTQSIPTHRSHAVRPSKIVTSTVLDQHGARLQRLGNSQAGPQSAGPISTGVRRRVDRAMTMDSLESQRPFSASPPGQNHLESQRSLASIGISGPKSAGFIAPSNSKPGKVIRRPSSYKELLHFWKAGESTPDLLANIKS